MRTLIQRVATASVEVGGEQIAAINRGLLVLLGISRDDNEKDAAGLAEKCLNLRLFDQGEKNFDLSVLEIKGEILVVSQFTLYADCRKGRSPDFNAALPPQPAERLYRYFIADLEKSGLMIKEGEFGAHMKVKLANDGPVTIILDSKRPII